MGIYVKSSHYYRNVLALPLPPSFSICVSECVRIFYVLFLLYSDLCFFLLFLHSIQVLFCNRSRDGRLPLMECTMRLMYSTRYWFYIYMYLYTLQIVIHIRVKIHNVKRKNFELFHIYIVVSVIFSALLFFMYFCVHVRKRAYFISAYYCY